MEICLYSACNKHVFTQRLFQLTLCWAQHPKTSGRNQLTSLLPYMEISIQFHKNLVNNNSTRLCYFSHTILHCLCVRSESESFWKSSRRNAQPAFKMDLFNDSDNDQRFSGFRTEHIMLWEAVADSEFNVNEVSSVHTSDWRNWQHWWLGWRYRDQNRWSLWTRSIDNQFTVKICRKN